MAEGYSDLANEVISAANGIDYAYRDTGGSSEGAVPLVLLQHFRGNLDNWDPALIDALAATRRVVTFDNAGVGGSTGTTPDTVEQMDHALLQRLSGLRMPVLVMNGDSDPMILPHYSYLLAGLVPQARVKIYPDSAHGFLSQHHGEFAADVDAFLTGAS